MGGSTELDVIGIGFGPGNIALAVALDELDIKLRVGFFERRPGPAWQPGMLLSGSDIQHNAARDLVLPRNPRSRYTFYNFLFEHGELFNFLNLGLPYPLRKDYARYVEWVADEFAHQVSYGTAVESLSVEADPAGGTRVRARFADGDTVTAKSAVVAPGRSPRIPDVFAGAEDPRIFHSSHYLHRLDDLGRRHDPTIAVIGGSQTAVELLLDISRRWPQGTVVNVMREFGPRQKDLSPFTNEVYFPYFTDYYYDSSENVRRDLDRQLRHTNYSAADIDVLQALYVQMYEDRLDNTERVRLLRHSAVTGYTSAPDGIRLGITEVNRDQQSSLQVDAVILATGFLDLTGEPGGEFLPTVLGSLSPLVGRSPAGRAGVSRNYRLLPAEGVDLPPIYLNGLCETTHGLGDAGSFSLLSVRSAAIATSLHKELASIGSLPGAPRTGTTRQRGSGS